MIRFAVGGGLRRRFRTVEMLVQTVTRRGDPGEDPWGGSITGVRLDGISPQIRAHDRAARRLDPEAGTGPPTFRDGPMAGSVSAALLALAHLRNGDTPARLAAGFEIGPTTAWRYIREAVDLLAATAPTLAQAMASIARLAYAILDGTLIRIDRLGGSANRRYFAGKPRHHAVNVEVIADCAGRLKWISPALPGSTHDLTAAREHGIIDALADKGVMTFADKGFQGAGGTVRTPHKRHHPRPALSRNQKAVNRSHAKIRALGERANATLKAWKVLARLHCCPQRATAFLAAIFVLQLVEEQRQPG